MSNELLFLIATLVDLAFVLFAWRMGKQWLFLVIAVNLMFTSIFGPKLITLFGYVVSVTGITYSAIFIGTDILTEHHGKKDGYKSIWIGFFGLVMLLAISQLIILFEPFEVSQTVSDNMTGLFGAIPRIMLASFTAYLIAQHFDVWFYHFIHTKTGGRFLWLRNNGSTIVSQALDSVLFFTVAFYGTLPDEKLIELVISGYIMKVIVAALDTPFIYLSYWVKGKKLSEAKHIPDTEN